MQGHVHRNNVFILKRDCLSTMDTRIIAAAFALMIALSIAAWGFFLYQSGITGINTLTTKGVSEMLSKATSLGFILFALGLSFTVGIIALLPHFYGRQKAYIVSFGGAFAGLAALIAMFGFAATGFITAIFFGIGIVAMLESVYLKKGELKRFVTFRTTASAAKALFILLAIGFFISTALVERADNEKNVKEFGDSVMELAIKPNAGGSGLTDRLAETLLASQKQAIAMISSSQQFQNLRGKQDPDVQAFVLSMDAIQQGMDSPEAKKKVADELAKRADESQQVITFDLIRQQSPALDLIAKYYWLVIAGSMAMLFMFLSNILLSNLAGFFAAAMRKIIEITAQATAGGAGGGTSQENPGNGQEQQ
ncbi:Uncharacterised protein [uncultured archaeon]|nr:Uncharacterised protein [uncultured archaeon]